MQTKRTKHAQKVKLGYTPVTMNKYTLTLILSLLVITGWIMQSVYDYSSEFTNLSRPKLCKECIHKANIYDGIEVSEVSDPTVCRYPKGNVTKYGIIVEKTSYNVGDTLHFMINVNNINNRCISRGNDVVFVRAVTGDSNISIAAVVDHLNGTYTGVIKLRWPGMTKLIGVVAERRHHIVLQKFCISRYGSCRVKRNILGKVDLRNSNSTYAEPSRCMPTPRGLSGMVELCNMTKDNYNLSWYCRKPNDPNVKCSDIQQYISTNDDVEVVDPYCLSLYSPASNGKITPITIDVKHGTNPNGETQQVTLPPCTNVNIISETWMKHRPSGYVENTLWKSTYCQANIENKYDQYSTCLRNKPIAMFGDSTLRQWFTYFENKFKTQPVNRFSRYRYCSAMNRSMGMSFSWAPHAMPYQYTAHYADKGSFKTVSEYLHEVATHINAKRVNKHEMTDENDTNRLYVETDAGSEEMEIQSEVGTKYITDTNDIELVSTTDNIDIDNINLDENGSDSAHLEILNRLDIVNKDIIIVIGVAFHLQAYHPRVFKNRIRNIARAVKYLHTHVPDVTVFIKGPHARESFQHLSVLYNEIIKDEFHYLSDKIFFLDQWSITVAFGDYTVHSGNRALSNIIYQMLTHVCK